MFSECNLRLRLLGQSVAILERARFAGLGVVGRAAVEVGAARPAAELRAVEAGERALDATSTSAAARTAGRRRVVHRASGAASPGDRDPVAGVHRLEVEVEGSARAAAAPAVTARARAPGAPAAAIHLDAPRSRDALGRDVDRAATLAARCRRPVVPM